MTYRSNTAWGMHTISLIWGLAQNNGRCTRGVFTHTLLYRMVKTMHVTGMVPIPRREVLHCIRQGWRHRTNSNRVASTTFDTLFTKLARSKGRITRYDRVRCQPRVRERELLGGTDKKCGRPGPEVWPVLYRGRVRVVLATAPTP